MKFRWLSKKQRQAKRLEQRKTWQRVFLFWPRRSGVNEADVDVSGYMRPMPIDRTVIHIGWTMRKAVMVNHMPGIDYAYATEGDLAGFRLGAEPKYD